MLIDTRKCAMLKRNPFIGWYLMRYAVAEPIPPCAECGIKQGRFAYEDGSEETLPRASEGCHLATIRGQAFCGIDCWRSFEEKQPAARFWIWRSER